MPCYNGCGKMKQLMKRAVRGFFGSSIVAAIENRYDYYGSILNGVSSVPGVYARVCPICGYRGKFKASGSPLRWDSLCAQCWSGERHRLLFLAINSGYPLPIGADVLHFAPESGLVEFIKPKARKYVTADLYKKDVDIRLNIEDIDLPTNSYDVIICIHILEHVDDRLALAEMYRVLRPGGRLYLMAPVIEGWKETYENSLIVTPNLQNIHFGQADHVRYYGADIRKRITSAGFVLEEYTAEGGDVVRYGLIRGEKVFIASRHYSNSEL